MDSTALCLSLVTALRSGAGNGRNDGRCGEDSNSGRSPTKNTRKIKVKRVDKRESAS
ncbi:hypothetical protein FA13DRAFT_1737697 [Coprinellus micaceus]|uniref:Uncharacterized protein n=1 Tax=Coprinellus micaceus TaxID=71717 RepID=A0A4Y7SW18_COPMI|nr:hypothetical protein FA13DRAFT_1737697 [Coprinellus micaceus]